MNTAGRSLPGGQDWTNLDKFELDDKLLRRLVDTDRNRKFAEDNPEMDFSGSVKRVSILAQKYVSHLTDFDNSICPSLLCEILL